MQAPQTSGNYIHTLQMAVRDQGRILREIRETYMSVVEYVMSAKFHDDTTVQVSDVLNRLQPIHFSLMEAEWDPTLRKLTQPVIATGEITSL